MHERCVHIGASIVKIVSNYLVELNALESRLPVTSKQSVRWKVPRDMAVKVNFDAAFCKQNYNSCSGIVIRDSIGFVLASKITCHDRIPSSFAAEAVACMAALNFCLDLGFPNLEVEGDALTIIKKSK